MQDFALPCEKVGDARQQVWIKSLNAHGNEKTSRKWENFMEKSTAEERFMTRF